MKFDRYFILILSTIIMIMQCSCGDSSLENTLHASFENCSGPYFGQDHPGLGAVLFMPGLISTNVSESNIAFLNEGRICVFSNVRDGVFYTFEENDFLTDGCLDAPSENSLTSTAFAGKGSRCPLI